MSATFPLKRLLAAVFVLNLIEFLQSGMIAFAGVPLMGYLGASPEEYSVVTALYAATAVTSIAIGQAVLRRTGWRNYLLASLAVFALGAGVCAASDTLWSFGCGRLLMAAGGGGFMTAARMLINRIPPSPQRIKGIAAFGAALAIGMAAAPWLASHMVAGDAWRNMFGVLLAPAGLAAVIMANLTVTGEQTDSSVRIDWLAAAALLGGTWGVLFAFQRAVFEFHAEATFLPAWFGAGMLGIGLFAWRQWHASHPLLQLRKLTNPRFAVGLAVFMVCYAVLGATNSMVPLFMQRGLGVSWEVAGAAQGAGMASALVAFAVMLSIVRRRPAARKFYVAAFALLATVGLLLSRLNDAANVWSDLVPPLACYGAFLVLAMATTALHAFRDFQHDETVFFNAQQLKNILSQFGLGFGIALANVGFQARSTQHYSQLAERFSDGSAPFNEQLGQLGNVLGSTQQAMAQLAQQLMQQTVVLTSVEYFWLLMWLGVAGALVMGLQRILD